MPIQVLMPALSPTMTEGKLAKWLNSEGDSVVAGDVLAESEADKATMEVEAVDEGKLGKILVPEGAEGIAVNTPIALLLGEDEDEGDMQGAPSGAPEPADVKPKKDKAEAKARPEAPHQPATMPLPEEEWSGKTVTQNVREALDRKSTRLNSSH